MAVASKVVVSMVKAFTAGAFVAVASPVQAGIARRQLMAHAVRRPRALPCRDRKRTPEWVIFGPIGLSQHRALREAKQPLDQTTSRGGSAPRRRSAKRGWLTGWD